MQLNKLYFSGIIFYTVGSELFSSSGPNAVYSAAFKKCTSNQKVMLIVIVVDKTRFLFKSLIFKLHARIIYTVIVAYLKDFKFL